MFFKIIIFCSFIEIIISSNPIRVVNGTDASIEEFPYLVKLRFFKKKLHDLTND